MSEPITIKYEGWDYLPLLQPTVILRWNRGVLQQLWFDQNSPRREWRDVPHDDEAPTAEQAAARSVLAAASPHKP